jgi:4a-hydroxytetrahydrobiopterin dehydratase
MEDLGVIPSWKKNEEGKIEREFKFKTFKEAFSFMTRVAFEAEDMDHHPDWFNSYNRVNIQLITHTSNTITSKDIELARRIDKINWA